MILGSSLGSFLHFELADAFLFYEKLSSQFDLNSVEIRFEKEKERPSCWYWEDNPLMSDFLENFEVCGAHLPFIHLNPISQNPMIQKESMKQLKGSMSAAAELNLDYAVMHMRGDHDRGTPQELQDKWTEIILDLLDHSTDLGVRLTIENADSMTNLKNLTDFVKKINSSKLKITLDIGHAYIRTIPHLSKFPIQALILKILDIYSPILINNGLPISEYITIHQFINNEKNLIGNIHLHDYNGLTDHLEIGKGKIDFSFIKDCIHYLSHIPLTLEVNFSDPLIEFTNCYNKIISEV
jgi:sugar phosphate isomerase/epimerase